jgi:hypothetical protein
MKSGDFLKITGFVIILEGLYLSCYITITRKTVSIKDGCFANFLYEQLFLRYVTPRSSYIHTIESL